MQTIAELEREGGGREKERERETDRQTDRQTLRQTETVIIEDIYLEHQAWGSDEAGDCLSFEVAPGNQRCDLATRAAILVTPASTIMMWLGCRLM